MQNVSVWVRWAILILLLVSIGLFGSVYFNEHRSFDVAAHKGMVWLRAYQGDYGNAGVLWALTAINTHYCHSPEFSQELHNRFTAAPRTPAEQIYFSYLMGSTTTANGSDTFARYDSWLIASLECKTHVLPVGVTRELFSEVPRSGYDLTHHYLALVYLHMMNCEPETEGASIAERIQNDALLMKQEEHSANSFSDISAERAALLLWGGNGSFVRSDWLDTIARSQDVSGGWGSELGAPPNPHTTALATWALVQATGRCPL